MAPEMKASQNAPNRSGKIRPTATETPNRIRQTSWAMKMR
jgi:hypothetical protein